MVGNIIDTVKVNYNNFSEFQYMLTVTVFFFYYYVHPHRKHNYYQFHIKTANGEVLLRTVDYENKHFQT